VPRGCRRGCGSGGTSSLGGARVRIVSTRAARHVSWCRTTGNPPHARAIRLRIGNPGLRTATVEHDTWRLRQSLARRSFAPPYRRGSTLSRRSGRPPCLRSRRPPTRQPRAAIPPGRLGSGGLPTGQCTRPRPLSSRRRRRGCAAGSPESPAGLLCRDADPSSP